MTLEELWSHDFFCQKKNIQITWLQRWICLVIALTLHNNVDNVFLMNRDLADKVQDKDKSYGRQSHNLKSWSNSGHVVKMWNKLLKDKFEWSNQSKTLFCSRVQNFLYGLV